VINKLVNKYLSAMDFFIQFEFDENFNETVRSKYREDFTYSSFSEGEKARINIALLFAWRAVAKMRNSASTNLLVLDEVFDGALDSVGTDELAGILESLAGDCNAFIITHREGVLDKFPAGLQFEKHGNFSVLVG
jgi:DNA repair exonuclease SbcCD ATPase subunit